MATCLFAVIGFCVLAVAAASTKHSHQHKRHLVAKRERQASNSAHFHPAKSVQSGAEIDGNSFLQSKVEVQRQKRNLKIPRQLVLIGKWKSANDVPGAVGRNVRETISLNEDLQTKWLSDDDCRGYLVKHFDEELVDIFDSETRGSFRGDICRTAVLANEGGFYSDLDVQWATPMSAIVDSPTTFMSVRGDVAHGKRELLNAVMFAEPKSAILNAVLQQIRMWYSNPDKQHGWMGPETLRKGMHEVFLKICPKQDHGDDLKDITCGPHNIRLYDQQRLHCRAPYTPECPKSRAQGFEGVKYGIFETGSRVLVGWPRFAECTEWGCHSGGWSNQKHTQHTSEDAESTHTHKLGQMAERFKPSKTDE